MSDCSSVGSITLAYGATLGVQNFAADEGLVLQREHRLAVYL